MLPFYLLVTTGYLVDASGYLVVNSGYLIATTSYFWLLLGTSHYFWFLDLVTTKTNIFLTNKETLKIYAGFMLSLKRRQSSTEDFINVCNIKEAI